MPNHSIVTDDELTYKKFTAPEFQYREKLQEVQAIQWKFDRSNTEEVLEFCNRRPITNAAAIPTCERVPMMVATKDGLVSMYPGSFVVRDRKGELSVIKYEDFQYLYEGIE
ncbi:MAG: hypothetical protein GF334_08835 [Candidatus Altiarchaeales archaeon]|nr:hypothetical protein [Candidatus Altiarchaeales archaeon]